MSSLSSVAVTVPTTVSAALFSGTVKIASSTANSGALLTAGAMTLELLTAGAMTLELLTAGAMTLELLTAGAMTLDQPSR